jgi:hypothetical protein
MGRLLPLYLVLILYYEQGGKARNFFLFFIEKIILSVNLQGCFAFVLLSLFCPQRYCAATKNRPDSSAVRANLSVITFSWVL